MKTAYITNQQMDAAFSKAFEAYEKKTAAHAKLKKEWSRMFPEQSFGD